MRLPLRMSSALQRLSAAALIAAALACSPSAAMAAEQWLKLTTPDFELFTPAGEKDARAAILHFQQIQNFFLRSTGAKSSASARVRVIVFRSEKEFRLYRPYEVAAAFYAGSNSRDYIVMKDITSDSYTAAVHEYFHLWVKNSRLPLWLNEGLADFYSTLAPTGDKVKIGDFPPGRFQALQDNKWVPLASLLTADEKSAFYNEKDRAGIYYAESWALVHMLNLSDNYRAKFDELYTAVFNGAASADSFQRVYGKSPAEIEKDLQQYVHGNAFKGALLAIKLEKATDKPEVQNASALESGMVLADLEAITKGKEADAKLAYEKLAREFPQSWEVEAALARLAWRANGLEEARSHFSQAVQLGSSDAQLYLDYSRLLRQANEPASALLPLLAKAVELNPDFSAAHYDLGYALFSEKKYREAIEQLRKVPQVTREQALSYFRLLAYAHYQLNELDDARKDAESARQYATATNEILETEKFIEAVKRMAEPRPAAGSSAAETRDSTETARENAPERAKKEPGQLLGRNDPAEVREDPGPFFKPPALFAEGILQSIDCLGKSARVRVLVAGKPMAFALVDPAAVEIKGSSGTIDFSCGKQQPTKIVIGYVLEDNRQLGTIGNVRSMEMK